MSLTARTASMAMDDAKCDTIDFRSVAVEYNTILITIRKEESVNFVEATNSEKGTQTLHLWAIYVVSFRSSLEK